MTRRLLTEGRTCESRPVRLYLDGNAVGVEGALAFAAALRTNQTLRILSLSWNGVRGSGGVFQGRATSSPHLLDLTAVLLLLLPC